MKKILVTIVKPEGVFLEQSVTAVTLPGSDGLIEILPGHEPMIIKIKEGLLKLDAKELSVKSGLAILDQENCKIILYS
jgi:F0F1-type ATP synthase epsilon subunit